MSTKTTLPALAGILLLGIATMTGCSKNESATDTGDRAICLQAGLRATTKAIVNTGTTFTAAVGGWESSTGSANYGSAKTWLTTSSITAAETAGVIALAQPQFYSQNGAVKTYIKAWYPAGTLADNGTVTFQEAAGYQGDGTDDVLLASEVAGSALDTEGKTLQLRHPLTQLKFVVESDALFGATTTLSSITVKEAALPTGFDLTTDAVTYAAAAPLAVPGIDNTQLITTTESAAGAPLMVKPFEGNTFKIDVVTSGATYRDVVVTIDQDATTLPGKAYTIKLSFGGYQIGASASVSPWDMSGTGSGHVTTE